LIEEREVVRLKIPYPDIQSDLAKAVHMYICVKKVHSTKRLVKCQSMKLKNIIGGAGISNYIIENADSNRNPFAHTTLIDCDKLFSVDALIPRTLLTESRPDIAPELFQAILSKLADGVPSKHKLSKTELEYLNPKID